MHAWEREAPREVVLDLAVDVDLDRAAASDDLADALDYGVLARAVAAHAEACECRLLEALAGSVARFVLDEFAAVSGVTVTADKPGALEIARSVAVELRRER